MRTNPPQERRRKGGRKRNETRGAKLVGVGGAIYSKFSQLGGDRVEWSSFLLPPVSRCADAVAPNSMSRRRGREAGLGDR